MQLALDLVAQRWHQRRAVYRPAMEPIDADAFRVERIEERDARAFVLAHHYSGSYPAAVASFGLIERVAPHQFELAGVAVFSVPVQPRAADSYGAAGEGFCDLGRFVLLDRVGGNGETFFLRHALRGLAAEKTGADGRPRYPLCLAYSDPMPRIDAGGMVRFAGHYGGIYSKSSAVYLGRATPRTVCLTRDGTIISARALSKLRRDDSGARYAYEQLRQHGAPAIEPGEASAAYVARALATGPFRKVRHRGNHAFALLPCGQLARRSIRERLDKSLPHPIRTDAPQA